MWMSWVFMPGVHWTPSGQRLCTLNMNEAVTFNWENTTHRTQELETSGHKQHRATKSLPPYPGDICDIFKVMIVCLIMLASSQRQWTSLKRAWKHRRHSLGEGKDRKDWKYISEKKNVCACEGIFVYWPCLQSVSIFTFPRLARETFSSL